MKKRMAIIAVFFILSVATAISLLLFLPREEEDVPFIRGEAEAVAITPAAAFNGLINPQRVFDELYYPIGLALMGAYLVVADSMCDRVQILSDTRSQQIGMPGRYALSYYYAGAFIDGFLEHAMFIASNTFFGY